MKKEKDVSLPRVAGGVLVMLLCVAGCIFVFQNPIRDTFAALKQIESQLAAVILHHDVRSVADIKSHYNSVSTTTPQGTVRILIVPGHEPDFGGAEFGDLKERDMTVELGQDLANYLQSDPHYQVFMTRGTQAWNQIFDTYFKENASAIAEWAGASRDEFSRLVSVGSTTRTYSTVGHSVAPDDVALRLYGITKWSNENKIDIALHIHFNDNTRHNAKVAGKYSGFAIYVPASQYGNSTTAKVIATNLFARLSQYNPVSSLKGESSGIIDEPELIAIGANNTADAASILIEYAYIYEPQFRDPQVRALAIKSLAIQTYYGLQDFFDRNNAK